MKDDRLYLIHMGECIERIERYTASGQTAFQADTLIQDAVLRNLHTLTESTQHISDSLKAAHPEVEWREIAQFRNVVVHDYLGIDLARVWDIVQLGVKTWCGSASKYSRCRRKIPSTGERTAQRSCAWQ